MKDTCKKRKLLKRLLSLQNTTYFQKQIDQLTMELSNAEVPQSNQEESHQIEWKQPEGKIYYPTVKDVREIVFTDKIFQASGDEGSADGPPFSGE